MCFVNVLACYSTTFFSLAGSHLCSDDVVCAKACWSRALLNVHKRECEYTLRSFCDIQCRGLGAWLGAHTAERTLGHAQSQLEVTPTHSPPPTQRYLTPLPPILSLMKEPSLHSSPSTHTPSTQAHFDNSVNAILLPREHFLPLL